jgi:hypothetical protein
MGGVERFAHAVARSKAFQNAKCDFPSVCSTLEIELPFNSDKNFKENETGFTISPNSGDGVKLNLDADR